MFIRFIRNTECSCRITRERKRKEGMIIRAWFFRVILIWHGPSRKGSPSISIGRSCCITNLILLPRKTNHLSKGLESIEYLLCAIRWNSSAHEIDHHLSEKEQTKDCRKCHAKESFMFLTLTWSSKKWAMFPNRYRRSMKVLLKDDQEVRRLGRSKSEQSTYQLIQP